MPSGESWEASLISGCPTPSSFTSCLVSTVDNLDPNFQSDQQSKRTPLHAAAQKGSVEICHVLLQVGRHNPSPPHCPLHPQHLLSLVPAFVSSSQAGANINAVDKQQRTPLMEAVVNNHLEVARYMVQLGGCVYSKVRDGAGGMQGRAVGTGYHLKGSLARVSPGRGWLYLSTPCSQNWELGNGQPTAEYGTGGRQCPGQQPGCPARTRAPWPLVPWASVPLLPQLT